MRKKFPLIAFMALCLVPSAVLAAEGEGDWKNIVEVWGSVVPPAAPQLSDVSVDPATTALLVLDMEELTCNAERRPRCLETLPRVAALLERAREAGLLVAHSQTSRATPFLPSVLPIEGEGVVKASVNKFHGTELDAILAAGGVKTVIVVGTAAHGAVLHTATAAGQRGLGVIIPVDGLSAEDLYTEQASVWALLAGPGTRRVVTLTTTDRISMP